MLAFSLAFGAVGCGKIRSDADTAATSLRLTYSPNLTHAPALAGVARGDFQKALGSVKLETRIVNAGPEAMEALLANEVDMAYVGPSPAVNTYTRSSGKALKILSGACSGGAALVARADVPVTGIKDLAGKRVAIPQLGGTQDVSLRRFLAANGLDSRDKGGSVEILSIKNPDILALFRQNQLDAAWVPEPWASRLIAETGAKLVVDERDLWPDRKFTTTVLVVRRAFLDTNRDLVGRFLQAHIAEIDWINSHASEAQAVSNSELKRLTGKELKADVLKSAWGRLSFTEEPNRASIDTFVQAATAVGYLKANAEIAGLYDLSLLGSARRTAAR